MNKKADVQIQETIIVIFIFMIILAFGLIFFYRYNAMNLQELNNYDKLETFYSMVSTFPGLPEVKCSTFNDESECIDNLKLIAFKDKGDFGQMNITIYQIYPKKDFIECNLNSLKLNKDCSIYPVYTKIPKKFAAKEVLFIPVSLYNPLTNEYGIGKAVLEQYR